VSHLPRRRRRLTVLFVVATLAVLAVGACTDDGSGSGGSTVDIAEIRDATFDAGSARYAGQVTFDAGGSGAIEGTSAGDPARGDATFPVRTTGGDVQEAEATWADGTLYVRRVVDGDAAVAGQSLLGRSSADLPWIRIPMGGLTRTLVSPYDPFSLVAQLADSGTPLQRDGSEELDGRTVDRYEVELGATAQVLAVEGIQLLVDDGARLAGVRLSGARAIDYVVSDYGVEVAAEVPSDDQIQPPSSTDVGGEDPAGPYELMTEGTIDGVTWQVLRAPATSDGSCWRLEAQGEIPLDPIAATEQDGSTCLAPIDPAVDEQVQIVFDTGSAAPFEGLVAVLPPGSQARLFFVDRTRQDVPVDPRGFLVWVGPTDPMPVVLQVTGPDGTQSECGPGSVSSLEDLDALSPDQVAALRDAPWLCLPA